VVIRTASLERFELDWLRRPADPAGNFALVEALRREAEALGVFRRADPLEGIQTALDIARAVNRV
jgi:hypothetical protein